MKSVGFEDVIAFIPGGQGLWSFLKGMTTEGMCVSCRDGGGNPDCAVRMCANEKDVEMCAFCKDHPCDIFDAFLNESAGYRVLEHDNTLLRDRGWDAWFALQDERKNRGYTYQDEKSGA